MPPIDAHGSEKWTQKANMPTGREGLSTTVVDGIIYAIGGQINGRAVSTVEAYDPVTDTWTTLADIPTQRFFSATAVVDGIIYVIGGGQGLPWVGLSTVEAYDPQTDTWIKKADMPTARVA